MVVKMSCIILVLMSMTSLSTAETFEAVFNMEGVKGTITFTENADGTEVVMEDFLPSGYNFVKIKSFPVMFGRIGDAKSACSSLGTDEFTLFSSSGAQSKNFSTLGKAKFFNRAVEVSGSELTTICANVLGSGVATERAKIGGTISGEAWIRRVSTDALIFGDVYYTQTLSGTRTVKLFTNVVGNTFETRCSNLGTAVKTLSSFNIATSSTEEGRIVEYVPTYPTTAKSIAFVKADGTIEACADIVSVAEESATAHFNWNNVFGTITMTQKSPFDKTDVTIDLSGLANTASGYHIHKFPVPQRLSKTEDRCGGALVSGHFNPYGIVVSNSPTAGNGTNDQYEIGDLSGKYGLLDSQTEYSATFVDWNLPLFGLYSVTGRSIVIHKGETGAPRWVCATIEPDYDITIGLATFKTPAYGTIYMMQRSNSPDADTSVFVDLANHNNSLTSNHNWHVHETRVGDDALTSASRCASAGPHYNPFMVDLTTGYSSCDMEHPYRCELGDSAGKLGTIDVARSTRDENSKGYFTDSYLPLSGPYNVLQRSVVVHVQERGAGRYACADILPLHMMKAKTGEWKGGSGDFGSMEMTQQSEFMRTKFTSSLSGLDATAEKYHIHETRITLGAADGDACQGASVGGHYNPFSEEIIETGSSNDKYEVGDLSGKYGLITSANLALTQMDTNLPLFTSLSASDKSIVIHVTGGDRWRCADLVSEPILSTGYVVTATVTFSDVVQGTIKLRQIVYEDWSAGLTGIEVNVSSTTSTLQHNWHIHIDPVEDEKVCSVAQGHYNPYSAPIGESYYASECAKNPLVCEVGDLSMKLGKYDIGAGKKTYNDVDVPLHTDFTVLGRSIVFHAEDGGADRYACANIIPDSNTYTLAFSSDTLYVQSEFITTIATALSISESRVVVVHYTSIPSTKDKCSYVMVYIVGGEKSHSDTLLAGTELEKYSETSDCESKAGATLLSSSGLSLHECRLTLWFSLVACFLLWLTNN